MTKPIRLGERTISFNDIDKFDVVFDSSSTIKFYNPKTGEMILQLDPTELSTIYSAYMGMRMEEEGE